MKRVASLLFVLLYFMTPAFSQGKKSAVESVAEAERAFARTSVKKGIRESFLEFFADDGINFQPHPTKTREALSQRPAAPSPVVLDWHPITADVSQAGDLGYTTGPYTLTDGKTSQLIKQGYYFSLWKKQADGSWKVVVDCGIDTGKPAKETRFQAARPIRSKVYKALVSAELAREEMLKVDREFARLAKQAGAGKAYASFVTDEIRVHRDGRLPIVGRKALRAFLAENRFKLTGEPIQAEVAASSDFGYTYGRYQLQYEGSQETRKGYYVRAWRRDGLGHWKVVLDTATILPKEEP